MIKENRLTKSEFIKRVQSRLGGKFRLEEVERVLVSIFDEIKEVVKEGDELHLSNFGRIYPKEMQPRTVKGGWYHDKNTEYNVPAKIKIGLSSFPTVDKYISQRKSAPRKITEDLFGEL